ncbi:MAG: hypothetical protein QHH10_09405 [Peptococcaceae bacterium]|jgi:hypothetical protein|nr:hypothetical protein [Peptococcaceae bacterium]MDH7525514.1 hypothetical protein [Peptococcaceae bacterium]
MPESLSRPRKSSRVIGAVLILALTAVFCFGPETSLGGVVSDVFGLDGLTGKVADDVFDGGCKLVGGTTYNLGKNIYDTLTGAINLLAGDHTTAGKVAGWTEVALNAASAGVIIYTLATGTATIPVIATITITVTLAKAAVESLKNIDKIFSWLKKYLGDAARGLLDVYKPNIYIYCEQDLEVRLQLEPYSYITASIPEYEPEAGWKAEVRGGSINGQNDYLFYEARVPGIGFQREKGLRINGRSLRHDLYRLMESYGFNARETADFVEYWEQKLSPAGNYIFYPQGTDIIENIMPLTVTPKPASVYRLWFLIEKDRGQPCETVFPIEKVTRSRFAVVEWGGVMGEEE